MLKIKTILDDLIEITYTDSPKKKLYKGFYIEFIDKRLKSKHGSYAGDKSRISIYNLYRNDAAIVATTVHELAHHVDWMNRGMSDHGKEFYEVFRVLLYKALDMGLFSKKEFLEANRDAADSSKIASMIEDYIPEDIKYKEMMCNVEVINGYDAKMLLKEKGYQWNVVNKVWEKEILRDDITEILFLEKLGLKYIIRNANELEFRKKSYVVAGKGSFEAKELLKAEGFVFDGYKKIWKKEGSEELLKICREKYPFVVFKII